MSKKPAGPGALKAALSKAETAASSLSGIGGSPSLTDTLLPLIQVLYCGACGLLWCCCAGMHGSLLSFPL